MDPKLYIELNKAWKSTCRILLGDEVGELKDYEEWLREYFPAISKRKSHVSKKEVAIAMDDYCKTANFVSSDEVKEKTIDPLTINEIKDIDSILRAISEKWEYCGNRALGNSASVEGVDLAFDSRNIYDSINLDTFTDAFLVFNVNRSKFAFGSGNFGESEFLIKFIRGTNVKRCFNCSHAFDSSELYCSHHMYACHDMLFCFHQINKNSCIGNLPLPKDKYLATKAKLLSEIRDEMKRSKGFPSIFQLVPNKTPGFEMKTPAKSKMKGDMSRIEKAFSSTFKIIFKKDFRDIGEYEGWLSRRIVPLKGITSPFGVDIFIVQYHPSFRAFSLIPEKRSVTYEEGMELGKLHITEDKLTGLEKVKEWFSEFCCFSVEYFSGENSNIISTPTVDHSANIYKTYTSIYSENCGVDSWALFSKYLFGCHWTRDSQFCVKCYNGHFLNRCFEVDSSIRCLDTLFSHNCEGLSEAMFCFNVKGKRYAVGNLELPKEKYAKLRDSVVEQIADEILKKKEYKLDAFNVGCCGR